MESLSEQLSDVILREQTDFDLIYGRIDATKDVAEVFLDHRDIEELKDSLKKEFDKDFIDKDIEKAEKQLNLITVHTGCRTSIRERFRKRMRETETLDYS